MHHAAKLIERIIFLDGRPNLQRFAPLSIGEIVTEVLEYDRKAGYTTRKLYMKGRSLCHD